MAKRKYKKTKITLIIILLLLTASGILLKMRWSAWFANSPEEPYTIPDSIARVTIVPGQDFETERTVSWLCGEEERPATLAFRALRDTLVDTAWQVIEASGDVVRSRAGQGAYYHACLSDLIAGETYQLRLRVGGSHRTAHQLRFA